MFENVKEILKMVKITKVAKRRGPPVKYETAEAKRMPAIRRLIATVETVVSFAA